MSRRTLSSFRFVRLLNAFLLVLALSSASLAAADVFWKQAVDGDWNDPNNWSGNAVPGGADDVFITTSGTYTVTVDSTARIGTFEIGGTSGTQSLVSTGHLLKAGTGIVVGTNARVQFSDTDIETVFGLIRNFGVMELENLQLKGTVQNFHNLQMLSNSTLLNTRIFNAITNATSGTIYFAFDGPNPVQIHLDEAIFNEGLIQLESLNLLAGGQLILDGPMQIEPPGGLDFLPGAGAPLQMQLQSNSFLENQGLINVGTQTLFNHQSNSPMTNAGVIATTNANLRINQGFGQRLDNHGQLMLPPGTLLEVQGGLFDPTTTGSIAGSGSVSFANVQIIEGILRNTTATLFLESSILNSSAELFNSSTMHLIDVNQFQGPVVNLTTASLFMHAVPATSAIAIVTSDFLNNGTMELGGGFFGTALRGGELLLNQTIFVNNGTINSVALPGQIFGRNSIGIESSTLRNNGRLLITTGANTVIANNGSRFSGGKGRIDIFGESNLELLQQKNFEDRHAIFTTAQLRIRDFGSQAVIFQSTMSRLNLLAEQGAGSVQIGGNLLVNSGFVSSTRLTVFSGAGTLDFNATTIAGSLNIKEANLTAFVRNSFSQPSSFFRLSGQSQIIGRNCFDGQVMFATTASVLMGDPFNPPPDPLSFGQQIGFKAGLINNGLFAIASETTRATLDFMNGDFINNGNFELFATTTSVRMNFSSNCTFLINTGATFRNRLTGPGPDHSRPTQLIFFDNAHLVNHGDVLFSTSLSKSFTQFALAEGSTLTNNGSILFRNFGTTAIIRVNSSASVSNTGSIIFDQDNSGARGGLFDRNGLLTHPATNAGIYMYRNFSTPLTWTFGGNSTFANTGCFEIRDVTAPVNISLGGSSSIVNSGKFKIHRVLPGAFKLGGNSSFVNSVSGSFTYGESSRIRLIASTNAFISNAGTMRLSTSSSINVNLQGDSKIDVVTGGTLVLDLATASTISLSTSSVMLVSGRFNIRDITSTSQLLLASNSQITIQGGGEFEVSTTDNFSLSLADRAKVINCNIIRMRLMQNSTFTLSDRSLLETKAGSKLLVGAVSSNSSIRLSSRATILNAGNLTLGPIAGNSTIDFTDRAGILIVTSGVVTFSSSSVVTLKADLNTRVTNSGVLVMQNTSFANVLLEGNLWLKNTTGGQIIIQDISRDVQLLSSTTTVQFNDGKFCVRNVGATVALIQIDNSIIDVGPSGSLIVSSASTFRHMMDFNTRLDNFGTIEFRSFTRSTINMPHFARITNSSGASLQISDVRDDCRIIMGTAARILNNGHIRLFNLATTSTILLSSSARIVNTSNSLLLFDNSLLRDGGLRIGLSNRSFIDNSGAIRFRNFATTATIFLGNSSRFIQRTGATFVFSTVSSFRIVQRGNSLFNNCGLLQGILATNMTLDVGLQSVFRNKLGASTFLTGVTGNGGIRLTTSATFVNAGQVRFRNFATTATIFLRNASSFDNKTTGSVEIENTQFGTGGGSSTIGGGRIELSNTATFNNAGTVRFRRFATSATIFLGDATRWTNSTGSHIQIEDGKFSSNPGAGGGGGRIIIGGTSLLDNHGTVRFRNFATTATIFLGNSSRWNNNASGSLQISTVSTIEIKATGDSEFNNRSSVQAVRFTTATITFGDTSRYNNKDGSFTSLDNAENSLRIIGVTNATFTNEGTIRFRNFATTATIFLGDGSRWENNTGATFEATDGNGKDAGVRLRLADEARFINGGYVGFRNFATTAVIRLGDAARWENNLTGVLESTTIGAIRIRTSGFSTFNNCGLVTARVVTKASIFVDGSSQYVNKDGARTTFSTVLDVSRLQTATNGTYINRGDTYLGGPNEARLVFEGNSRIENSTGANLEVNGEQGANARLNAEIKDNARFENDGLFKVDDVKFGISVKNRDSGFFGIGFTGEVEIGTSAIVNIFTFGAARQVIAGDMKIEDPGKLRIEVGNSARVNCTTTGSLRMRGLRLAPGIRVTNSAVFANSGRMHISDFTRAVVDFGDDARFTNDGRIDAESPTTHAVFKIQRRSRAVFGHSGVLSTTKTHVKVNLPSPFARGTLPLVQIATNAIFNYSQGGATQFHNGNIEFKGRFFGDGKLHFSNATVHTTKAHIQLVGSNARVIMENTEFVSTASFVIYDFRNPWVTRIPLELRGLNLVDAVMTTAGKTVLKRSSSGTIDTKFDKTVTNTGDIIMREQPVSVPVIIRSGEDARFFNTGRVLWGKEVTQAQIVLERNARIVHSGQMIASRAVVKLLHSTGAKLTLVSRAKIELDRSTIQIVTSNQAEFRITDRAVFAGTGQADVGNVQVEGITTPGRSAGILEFVDDYFFTSTANLNIELGGSTTAGVDYDQLIADDVTLDGTLNISLINGFTPAAGDRFVIMKYNSVTGAFASVTFATVVTGLTLSVESTQAVLQFGTAAPLTLVDVNVYLDGYWNGLVHKRSAAMLELRSGPNIMTSATVARVSTLLSSTATHRFSFENLPDASYWLILRHGGHLPAASIGQIAISQGVVNSIDFTLPANVINGLGQMRTVTLNGTNYNVLRAGDMNGNQDVGSDDFIQYFLPNFGIANPGLVPTLD